MSPIEETIAKAVEQRADRIVETLCDIVRFSFHREIRIRARPAGVSATVSFTCRSALKRWALRPISGTPTGLLYMPNMKAALAPIKRKPHLRGSVPNLAGVLKGKGDGTVRSC